ncbi:MAG: D-alanine--D-alanine ligase family protein [Butyricicoccus sp.]
MKLLILFGGLSNEHEVSRVSASSIVRNADKEKYELVTVGITKDGRWLLYENADPDKMASGAWEQEATIPAMLVPDRSVHGLIVLRDGGTETIRIDCCFPVLHGFGGEDGTVQGLLTLAGIPFVGPGVAASADSMDKSLTKGIVARAGVRQAAYYVALRPDFVHDADTVMREAMDNLKQFPVFIKPCSSGSSVGVHKATDLDSLREGLEEAFQWDSKVLVEEFIAGREVEVAVLGNRATRASIAGEIAPTQEFYTYDAKYNDDSSALYIPARIPDEAMETVRKNALRVFSAMGCRGLSRVDFFCTFDTNEIIFNEINTIPGFTSISMYPKLFAHEGISYPALIDALVELALEEHHG